MTDEEIKTFIANIRKMKNLKQTNKGKSAMMAAQDMVASYSFGQTAEYIKNGRCSSCNGFHGMWNGKPVECVDLQAGFNWGLSGIKNGQIYKDKT